MAKPHKKGESLHSQFGRPIKGALSTYPQKMRDDIFNIRNNHEGWGASLILVELEGKYGYSDAELPSNDAVNRYLKQEGFIKERAPKGHLQAEDCKPPRRFHDLWEMDAQGAVAVDGLGHVSNINIKDTKSRAHCMAFPVHVKGRSSQPKTNHYLWTLRLAFEQWGLPKAIQVDRDSVFIDSASKSPFPSKMHLFLIGLGVKLCFIDVPPPSKQAMVERSHQSIDKQTLQGQHYDYWKQLFSFTNERRRLINEKLPNRLLDKKAPLVIFPKAKHSGRPYTVEQEAELISMPRIHKHLAKCLWYRKVSSAKTVSLDGETYYLKEATPSTQLEIKFCNRAKKIIFRDAKERIIAKTPIKNFSIQDVMGVTTKELISMKKKLFYKRGFPL